MVAAFALAVIAGCGPSDGAADGGAPFRHGRCVDGGTGDDGGSFAGALCLPFGAEIHWAHGQGQANDAIEAADISANVGTIVYRGRTLPALVYGAVHWGLEDIAMIVATTADNLYVLYMYCSRGGSIVSWYHEALDEPFVHQKPGTSNGSCFFSNDAATTSDVAFLPFVAPPPGLLQAEAMQPTRRFATTVTIKGTRLNLASGQGAADFDDGRWQVIAFDWVDCSTCDSPGWYELHSLLQRGPAVSFGIFYLFQNQKKTVGFSWPFRFDSPSLQPRTPTDFTATWTAE